MKIRALSSFFHPQEGARAEGRDTQRCCIPMHPHRRATQTRLLRLAHAVKCRRQRSPCRRQQLRREAQPPCALLHRVQALGSENLNRLNLVLVSAGWRERTLPKVNAFVNFGERRREGDTTTAFRTQRPAAGEGSASLAARSPSPDEPAWPAGRPRRRYGELRSTRL